MTPSSLAHSLLRLRGLVEREEAAQHILHSIDSFSIEVRSCERHLAQVEAEALELRSEAKKLRSRTRKLENQLCHCAQQKDELAQELKRTQDVHRSKVQKMALLLETQAPAPKTEEKRRKGSKCSFGAQCQILTQSTILQLQEKAQILLRRMKDLQERYEEQSRENLAKDGYIEELLLTFETAGRRSRRNSEEQEDYEKENDNSTLDNDSEKDSEFALPEWLDPPEFEPSESKGEQEEEGEGGAEGARGESWLESLRSGSLKLCSFIFG